MASVEQECSCSVVSPSEASSQSPPGSVPVQREQQEQRESQELPLASQQSPSPFSFALAPLTIARRTDMRFEFSPADPRYPDRQNSFRMIFGRLAANPDAPPLKRLVLRGRYSKG